MFERLHTRQANFERVLEELQLQIDSAEGEMAERTKDATERLAKPSEIFSEVVHQLEEMQERE